MAEEIIVTGYFSATRPGFVRKSTGDKNEYLRGDGTWGTITSVPDLGDNSLLLGQIQEIAAYTMLGNNTGSTGDVLALTRAQVRALLGLPAATWSLVAKTADQTFTSTTPADVSVGASGSPYMGWTLLSAHTYHFRYVTLVRSSTASIGVGLSVTTPTYATFGAYGLMIGQVSAGPSVVHGEAITASDDHAITSGVDTINTDYVFLVEGIIQPNAGGDLRLRARIETGNATVTVRQGSFGMLMDQNP